MGSEIAIVGGGLAGLACAVNFERWGIPYKLFEASTRAGGRVESYTRKQLIVDRGFQVFLPHYKVSRQFLSLPELELCYYPSGASIATEDGRQWFGHPLNYPKELRVGKKVSASLRDYLQLGLDVLKGIKHPVGPQEQCIDHFNQMFSTTFSSTFLKPFFRGVFLDPNFEKSINQYQYYLHCFFRKGAAIPKRGMQAIPDQLLQQLSKGTIEYDARVTKIEENQLTINNQTKRFKHICIATDFSTAYKLLQLPEPMNPWCSVSNYIFAKKSPTKLAPLTLVASDRLVSHINIPTLVSSDLAPKGTHYMNVSSFSKASPKEIERDVHAITKESDWQFVWHDSIDKALPKFQLSPQISNDHISICGDWTTFPSIEGAFRSGQAISKKLKSKV